MRANRFRIRGFTLVEIIVALAVLGILVALSMPMYGSFVANSRARTVSYSLVGTLTFARSEAVKRNAQVTVVPSDSGWQDGWRVQLGDTTLAQSGDLENLVLWGPPAGISFEPTGRLSTPGIVTFTISPNSGYTRCVTIGIGGQPSVLPEKANESDCS